MKIYFQQIVPYLKVSYRLVQQLRRQKQYIKSQVEPILEEAERNNDGSLEKNDFLKIRNYYALFVVAIVGENYCTLRGTKLSARERKILTFQGALTGLYDDFFDNKNRKQKPIKEMMQAPFAYPAKDSVEKLFLHFLQNVHNELEERSAFDNIFDSIYNIQVESQKQINSHLSALELKSISEKKGGLSHLFYRVTLSHPLAEGEYDAIYELGSLLQQVNDIFDIWKDTQSGVSTFASVASDMELVKKEFEEQLNKVYLLVNKLNYPAKNKRDFFLQLMILIGMGIVSLNQYIALQNAHQGKFDSSKFSRKELVCDMQKKQNLLALMKVCLSFDFSF